MIESINRIFALLAKQNFFIYVLSGILLGFLFTYFVDIGVLKSVLKKLCYFVLFIVVANGVSMHCFYGRHELMSKKLTMKSYITTYEDSYFYTKITSNISFPKKISGYLYVLLRIMLSNMVGFVCVMVLLILTSNA